MPTETFTYNSNSSQTWTVPSGVSTIQIEAYGAGGGTSESTGGSNNSGGYAKTIVGVSPGDVIELWVAEPVAGATGSWGRYNGGDGESGQDFNASGGAGSTEARNSTTGTDLVGAGGGGGDHSNGGHNGGGGAQGGTGGPDAEDGGGSLSFGGDGGQGFSSPDAEPGDGHVYNGTNTETVIGGGNAPESSGTIVIKYGLTAPTGVGVTASAENENTVTHDQPPTGDPDGYNYYHGEYDATWPGDFTLVGSNDAQTNTQFVDTGVPEDGERYEYVVTSRIDIPDSVVVNFESGNLNDFTNTANFSITSSTVAEGSNALSIDNPTNLAFMYSLPGDGLPYYPQKGDKVSCLLYEGAATIPAFGFGLFEDSSGLSGYAIEQHQSADDLIINRLDNGSSTIIHRPTVSLSVDTWYEYEVQWHDGTGSEPDNTIEVTIYETDMTADLSSELGRSSQVFNTTVSDATYPSNRGVGFSDQSSNTGGRYADRYWHLGSVD